MLDTPTPFKRRSTHIMSDPRTSRKSSRPTPDEWRELEVRILANLDIKAAYESMGVVFTGRQNGQRLMCRAVDRVEKGASDSAGVNVGDGEFRGRYYDFGGQKLSLSLWEFGAKFGKFTDWRACRRHFAKVASVPYPDEPDHAPAARPA